MSASSKKVMSELQQLRQDVAGLKEQYQIMTLELKSLSDTFHEKLEECQKSLQEKNDEIKHLREFVSHHHFKLNNIQQHSLKNELQIIGVPELKNEDLFSVAIATARMLGVELWKSDIDNIYRLGPRRPLSERPRSIVLKLMRQWKRQELFNAMKEKRPLSTAFVVPGTFNTMYINERLTLENVTLYKDARQRISMHEFKYCWVKNGMVFVKESDKKTAIAIKSYCDLDAKVGSSEVDDDSDAF